MSAENEASALQLIRHAMPSYTGARLRIAEAILGNPAEAGRATITSLAEQAGTTPSTVTRMTAALGFTGFQSFRAAIALDAGRGVQAGWEEDIGAQIGPDDSPYQILKVLAHDQFQAMRHARIAIDLEAVSRVATAIVGANRVHIFGEWGDGIPALELHTRLLRIGVPTGHYDGAQASRITSNLLRTGDVAIAFTRTGEDEVAGGFLSHAKDRGALTVLITGAPDAPMTEYADITIYSGTPVGLYWTDYFAGRAGDSLAASLLWVLVVQRYPDGLAAMAIDRRRGTVGDPKRRKKRS